MLPWSQVDNSPRSSGPTLTWPLLEDALFEDKTLCQVGCCHDEHESQDFCGGGLHKPEAGLSPVTELSSLSTVSTCLHVWTSTSSSGKVEMFRPSMQVIVWWTEAAATDRKLGQNSSVRDSAGAPATSQMLQQPAQYQSIEMVHAVETNQHKPNNGLHTTVLKTSQCEHSLESEWLATFLLKKCRLRPIITT